MKYGLCQIERTIPYLHALRHNNVSWMTHTGTACKLTLCLNTSTIWSYIPPAFVLRVTQKQPCVCHVYLERTQHPQVLCLASSCSCPSWHMHRPNAFEYLAIKSSLFYQELSEGAIIYWKSMELNIWYIQYHCGFPPIYIIETVGVLNVHWCPSSVENLNKEVHVLFPNTQEQPLACYAILEHTPIPLVLSVVKSCHQIYGQKLIS